MIIPKCLFCDNPKRVIVMINPQGVILSAVKNLISPFVSLRMT
jgi:hypothetical protein